MFSNRLAVSLPLCASLLTLGLTVPASHAQMASLAAPRVLGPVNESQVATIQGRTLPLAQARFDRGRLPDSTPRVTC
jgi:hypothetical protein